MRKFFQIFFILLVFLSIVTAGYFSYTYGLKIYSFLDSMSKSGFPVDALFKFLILIVFIPVLFIVLFFLIQNRTIKNAALAEMAVEEDDEYILEDLTLKDPGMSEIMDIFNEMNANLSQNLLIIESFKKRIEEDFNRKEQQYSMELESAKSFEDTARDMEESVGKFEIFKQMILAFSEAEDAEKILKYIIDMGAAMTKSARASLMLVEKGGKNLYLYKTLGWEPDQEVKAQRVPMGQGFAGKVAEDNKRMLVTDIEAEAGMDNKPAYNSKSFIILPVRAGNKVIGVFNLTDKKDGEVYTMEDLELLNLLIAQSALALGVKMIKTN